MSKSLSILWFDPPDLSELRESLTNAEIDAYSSTHNFENTYNIVVFDPQSASVYGHETPQAMLEWLMEKQPSAQLIAHSFFEAQDLGVCVKNCTYVQENMKLSTIEDLAPALNKSGCVVKVFGSPWKEHQKTDFYLDGLHNG